MRISVRDSEEDAEAEIGLLRKEIEKLKYANKGIKIVYLMRTKDQQAEIERLRAELTEAHTELKNALSACESAEEANRRYREEHGRLGSPSNILIHAHAVGHGFHLHCFEDDRSTLDYAAKLIKKGVHPDPRRISEMTWHPKKD